MIELIAAFGLAAAGICSVVWKVVGDTFNRPDLLLVPPLGCMLCSSWWSSLGLCLYGVVAGLIPESSFPVVFLGAISVSLLVLTAKNRMS